MSVHDLGFWEESAAVWQGNGAQEIDAGLWLDECEQLMQMPSATQRKISDSPFDPNCFVHPVSNNTLDRNIAVSVTNHIPELVEFCHAIVDGREVVPSDTSRKTPELMPADGSVSSFVYHAADGTPSLEEKYESYNSMELGGALCSHIKEKIDVQCFKQSNKLSRQGTFVGVKRPKSISCVTSRSAKRVQKDPSACQSSGPPKLRMQEQESRISVISRPAKSMPAQTELPSSSSLMWSSEYPAFDVGLSDELQTSHHIKHEGASCLDGKHGLELVHLLLACAEAVAYHDSSLATFLLDQLSTAASCTGNSIQRIIYCFAEGLSLRLATLCGCSPPTSSPPVAQRKEGLLHLYDCSPYLTFCFFTANEAILQVFRGKHHLHIIDLGMMIKFQWPSLIHALANRVEGAPASLRITAIPIIGLATVDDITQWGQELKDYASTQQVQLEFQALSEHWDISILESIILGVGHQETLAINSVLQLHRTVKGSKGSLMKVLQNLQKLDPAVMTVVEQDGFHNGPFFLGRFVESLHYYSAIFDSLEASLPRNSTQRMKVERLHYAEEIKNIVACEGMDRVERHETGDQWRRQMGRAGFQSVSLKFISQESMPLSIALSDGYTVAEEKGCLILGWKSKPIIHASAWKPSSSLSNSISLAKRGKVQTKG